MFKNFPQEYCTSNIVHKNIVDKNIDDKNIFDKNIVDKNIDDKNISDRNVVDKNIVHNFWRGMKILDIIYPNVGHSKSGRKLSPRVDKAHIMSITKY